MGIVTKQGDRGRTKLLSGEEVSKADARLEILGTLDELCAQLGLARGLVEDAALSAKLRSLIVDLFRIGSEVARGAPKKGLPESIGERHVAGIEGQIAALEAKTVLPRSFIVPGATAASAAVDVARAVARRLERRVVAQADAGGYANPHGMAYLNRLSNYLFLLARAVEQAAGVPLDAK